MWANVTPAVLLALYAAQTRAWREGAGEIRPSDLLHGLVQEQEGKAVKELLAAGLELSNSSDVPGTGGEAPITGGEITLPLSKGAEVVLAAARKLAKEVTADRSVTSDQLLLVLLREEESLRIDLEARGLNCARLEANILTAESPPLHLDEPLRLQEPAEQVDVLRILDASANRAREALRVLEDYCRFVLDDSFLTGELKTLRHKLTEVLTGLGGLPLLAARDTLQDVGTALTTPQEQERSGLAAVAQANGKRLQEALRSLEEFTKLHDANAARTLEQLRYQSYTLEKAIVLGATARQRLADARLYVLVTAAGCKNALEWTIGEAATGGAQIIQLREKNLPDRELLERARKVRLWTRRAGVLFIMNDRADLARLAEADGVHLGQDDVPVQEARGILGADALIGVSTHTLEQCRQAVRDGASYIGVGPTFPSGTKSFAELAGLEFVRRAGRETSLPAFVIGGITLDNLPAALAAGARRVAVSRSICQSEDPRSVAVQFRHQLDHSASNQ